jgi:tRNA-splicing ligase RtcB (3'-phosphate/5'-hydroxy nucleic acid ligase)
MPIMSTRRRSSNAREKESRVMEVITTEKLPIKLWPPAEIDWADDVLQQFRNLANHPLAFKHVAGMPDFHLGYGMPIGGVLATVGGVVPNAVGVDIGCGMVAMPTQWVSSDFDRDTLQALRVAIHRRVPVGKAHHVQAQELPGDLLAQEHGETIAGNLDNASYQIGTLGGGNHFIEIQREDTDYDNDAQAETAGRVWIMLHSGSRNVGYRVCQHYHKIALKLMEKYHSPIPDRDLAFLADGTKEFGDYLTEMKWCMTFAEENRVAMLSAVFDAFREITGDIPLVDSRDVVDTHHNFVAKENHFGQNVWVHRKGAVRATGLVTIPGSMGTASYIGRGLEPRESFNTCAHGAGRMMGRRQAKATITHEEAVAEMAHVVFGVREGEVDEMPRAYKDIDAVMTAQTDLVAPIYRLLPLAVVKG